MPLGKVVRKMTNFAEKMQKNDWVFTPNIFVSGLCEGRPDTKEQHKKHLNES
jgi:hypothetical protein